MKITVIGGGPGGLYFSILLKKAVPDCTIDLYERNRSDDAFGFGVVFSDETLSEFLTRDPQSYELIRRTFAYWDDLDVVRNGETVRITGNGFCGCSRKTLLQLLQQRCREEGVNLHFETRVDDLSQFGESDIIVASDGINSFIRESKSGEFGTKTVLQRNKFVWMGSTKPLDAFAYFFRETPNGTIVAHTYQYEEGRSTWIFECTPETWENCGFETFNEEDTIARISEIFKEELDGHPLISNKSHWRQFPTITNERWSVGNIVLLGDAKATAHYSIGSGTKLAMECAIALADSVAANQNDVEAAFKMYEKLRRSRVEMIQHAARVSLDWFEHIDRHVKHPFMQFAFGVMTRAKKVTYENLALRDKSFTQKVLAEFNHANQNQRDTPAAFSPLSLGGLTINNRIAMAPMPQNMACDGVVSDWHLMHYGSRAIGGVGLIITEMIAVNDNGKLTHGCPMIVTDEQIIAWKRTIDFIHRNSECRIAANIGHAGRKSITNEKLAASEIALGSDYSDEINVLQMDELVDSFIRSMKNSVTAGFDMIEIQMNDGSLLASFLSPLSNQRQDEFGGDVANRIKFPLRVLQEIRKICELPISVSISASDWATGGITESDVTYCADQFKKAGADIINVTTGGTVSNEKPEPGRMWQTPFSDLVRNTCGVPTITSGSIQDIDQINTVILNGRADIVALGRPLLLDPGFVRNAQAYENYQASDIPEPYQPGISHLYPVKAAERREKEAMKKALKPESHNSSQKKLR